MKTNKKRKLPKISQYEIDLEVKWIKGYDTITLLKIRGDLPYCEGNPRDHKKARARYLAILKELEIRGETDYLQEYRVKKDIVIGNLNPQRKKTTWEHDL